MGHPSVFSDTLVVIFFQFFNLKTIYLFDAIRAETTVSAGSWRWIFKSTQNSILTNFNLKTAQFPTKSVRTALIGWIEYYSKIQFRASSPRCDSSLMAVDALTLNRKNKWNWNRRPNTGEWFSPFKECLRLIWEKERTFTT